MVNIAIAEDQLLFSKLLRTYLNEFINYRVVLATDEREVMENLLFGDNPPDVLLLDIVMPDFDGIEFYKELKSKNSNQKVIFITQNVSLHYIQTCMQLGADGFIGKKSELSEIVKGIDAVISGNKFISSDAQRVLDRKNSLTNLNNLSKREYDILNLLSLGKSTHEIGEELYISFFTVETHKKNLYAKMGVSNIQELVARAKEVNLIN
jgi:DNA-binding NarL/FixJ family response regulator